MAASSQPSLLILPSPPYPAKPASLSAAYRPALTAALTTLSKLRLPSTTILEIVLPITTLDRSFETIQKTLAGLYSLICIVCAKESIEMYGPGSVDARVILLSQMSVEDGDFSTMRIKGGPITDLGTLASTRRRWQILFSVDGEEGQEYLSRYSKIVKSTLPPLLAEPHIVSGGVSLISAQSLHQAALAPAAHHIVAVGGTFDHLHAGHKLLLTATALALYGSSETSSRRLIVGITGDELLKNKKYSEYLGSWEQRASDVVDFMKSILSFAKPQCMDKEVETVHVNKPGPNGKAIHTTLKSCSITIECVEIQDPFGPTITDESITALVVSGETRSGGRAVNTKRAENGWAALEVFEVDVLNATDEDVDAPTKTENFDSKISSTAIRKHKAELKASASL